MPKLRTTLTFWITLFFLLCIGLQYFPVIPAINGFFLVTAGIIWVGYLPHLIALAFVIDILIRKKFPKFLLILPLLPYAAYYVFFALDTRYLKNIEQELQSQNPAAIIQYDPSLHDLIVPDGLSALAQRYKIPVIYEGNINVSERYLSSRIITGDFCKNIRGLHPSINSFGVSWNDGKNLASFIRFHNICVLRMPDTPKKQRLIVQKKNLFDKFKKPEPNLKKTEYGFYLEQEQIGTFTTARYETMPRFPKLVIGCVPLPKQQCIVQLRYENKNLNVFPSGCDIDKYGEAPITQMLKIEKYTEADLKNFQNDPAFEKLLKELITQKQEADTVLKEWQSKHGDPYEEIFKGTPQSDLKPLPKTESSDIEK